MTKKAQKKDVPTAKETSQSTTTKVPQSKSKVKSKKRSSLTYRSCVRTLGIKCYAEQLGLPSDAKSDEIRTYLLTKISSIPKEDFQVQAIIHDRDSVETDGFWQTANEKPHIHIAVRKVARPGKSLLPFRVKEMLDMLGVNYRPDIDSNLWNNHGVETLRDYKAYSMYLTHETEQAQLDGKEYYRIGEIISNMTIAEIGLIREGYARTSDAGQKTTMAEMSRLDDEAYERGHELKSFDDWYHSQPFRIRANAKMKTVKESYFLGIEARLEERLPMTRLCVFIQGDANTGKTYAASKVLEEKRTLVVGGGGTGKFDNLTVSTEAIIVDDDTCPNLLNICDNYVCRVYRRNNNNPVWAGKYFIVTSNLSFSEWLTACGIKSKNMEAVISRFFICSIRGEGENKRLSVDSYCTRGSKQEREARRDEMLLFKQRFDETIKQYQPKKETIDFSCLADDDVSEWLPIPE